METPVYGCKVGQPVIWFHEKLARSNQCCPYCGDFVGVDSLVVSNKEHLIARNFVPTGSLADTSFNFIFRSCKLCNDEKGAVEGHVSSVTLFNSPACFTDQNVAELAEHKASHDFHPIKKGVLVKDATEDRVVEYNFGGSEMKFGLIGPPQLDPNAVHMLAIRQVQGLFALITTEDP